MVVFVHNICGSMTAFLKMTKFSYSLLCLMLVSAGMGNVISNLIPNDPAFDFPAPSKPGAGCSACGGTEGLDLVEEDKAIMSVPADLYAPQFTRSLLRVEAGIPNYQWDPSRVYTLVATGRKGTRRQDGEVSEVTAFLQRVIVIFTISRDEDGEVKLACKSHPDEVTISRRENELCLTTGSGDQYFFEADDIFGRNWHLTGLGHRLYTWRTQIEYQEQAVSRIIYPDQSVCELESENGLCVSATFPNGEKLVIGRDPAGFISSVECFAKSEESTRKELVRFTSKTDIHGQEQTDAVYRTVTEKAEPVCYKRYLFDNDHKGRIVHLVTPCNRATELTYTFHEDQGGRTYEILAIDEQSGTSRYMRQIVSNGYWIFDRGLMQSTTNERKVATREIRKKLKDRWVKVYFWYPEAGGSRYFYDGETKHLVRREYDDGRVATWTRTADGTLIECYANGFTRRSRFDPTTRTRISEWGEGIRNERVLDDEGRVLAIRNGTESTVITYLPDGYIDTIEVTEGTSTLVHHLSYDALKRVIALSSSNGSDEQWTYDERGLIIASSRNDGETRWTTQFAWDAFRRLRSIHPADGFTQQASYSCSGMTRLSRQDETLQRFKYDDQGRLIARKSGESVDTFHYDAWGYLQSEGMAYPAAPEDWRDTLRALNQKPSFQLTQKP